MLYYFFAVLNAFWHASLIALEEQVAPDTVFTPSAFPFARWRRTT